MNLQDIPVALIDMSRFNTRKDLGAGEDDAGLAELADSIEREGLLNPVTVFPVSGGRYELVAGQRRLLTIRRLGWETISANVREPMDEATATAVSLSRTSNELT